MAINFPNPSEVNNEYIDDNGQKWQFDGQSWRSIAQETDPIFTASPAFQVTPQRLIKWDTSFSWGNHDSAGYATESYISGVYDDIYSILGVTSANDYTSPLGLSENTISGDIEQLSNIISGLWTRSESHIYYNSGNVGIGTETPSEKLHVDGDSFINGVLKLSPKQIFKVLTASDAGYSDYFGTSVALSSDGSVIAVGSLDWDGSAGGDQGGVYIYDWSGNSWVQRGNVLTADTGSPSPTQDPDTSHQDDSFGTSVALSSDGTILAVGAKYWDGSETNQGAVYIYDWIDNSWVQRGSVLTADTGSPSPTQDPDTSHQDDSFGSSVALSSDGSVLAVGSMTWDGFIAQGAVYIYDISGNTWNLRGNVLTASDAKALDRFGKSVALSSDGSVLAVGASGRDFGTQFDNGSVYIYDLDKITNGRTQRGSVLTAEPPGPGDNFGTSVALSSDGSVLAVGAYYWDGDGGADQGAVYIYDRNGDTWDLRGSSVLTASDGGGSDHFGTSVALSSDGSVLVVGADRWDGDDGGDQGGVYTYSLEANSFPLSVSDKGYGLNVINDKIVLNSDVGIGTVAPVEKLEVDGAVKIGNTTTDHAGTIRWTGTDFEGNFDGLPGGWNSLGSSNYLKIIGVEEKFTTNSTTIDSAITVEFDTSSSQLHYLTQPPSSDFTAKLINFSLDIGNAKNVSIIVPQSSSPYALTDLLIDSVGVNIRWQGGVVPNGTAGGTDIFSFTILNTGDSQDPYTVLGQMIDFG